jgi:hypothetical protein
VDTQQFKPLLADSCLSGLIIDYLTSEVFLYLSCIPLALALKYHVFFKKNILLIENFDF